MEPNEIDAMLNPAPLVPGGLPPLPSTMAAEPVDEIDALLNPTPPQTVNVPTLGRDLPNANMQPADPREAIEWIKKNPQTVLDLILQSGGTAAGIGLGVATLPVTGPVGPIVGGATGNVAGKQLSRRIGQALDFPDAAQPPDLNSVETAIDAGLGAVGPVVSSAARPLARAFTGASPKVVSEQAGRFADITRHADDAAAARATGREADFQGFLARNLDNREEFADLGRSFHQQAQQSTALRAETVAGIERTAAEAAENAAQRVSGNIGQLTNFGAIGSAFATGDLTTALGILGAGHALSAGQRRAATSLMKNERFVNWLSQAAPKTRSQLSGSLSAILAEQQLTPAERADITTLQGIRPRRTEGATYDASVDRHRDPAGRFVGGPVPHGTRIDGSHPDDDQGDEQ